MSDELPREDDVKREKASETLVVRLTPSLMKRIKAYEARLAKEEPAGITIATADAVRALLTMALDDIEGKKRR